MSTENTIPVNRKTVGVAVAAALALFGLGSFVGRATYGPNIEYRDRVVEKWDVKVVEKEKVVVIRQTEVKKAASRTWEKTTKPDGTTTEKVSEKTDEVANTTDKSVKEIVKVEEKVVYVDRLVEKKVEVPLSQWRAGIDAGVEIPGVSGDVALREQPWVLGIHAERRLVGPFWLGLAGNSSGLVGLSGSVEF